MITELERFLLAAQEGNITKTAEKIFITQSALTQSLQRLEKALGTNLFIQKGKYLQLTEEGKDVQIIASKIMNLWQNAKDPQLRKEQQQTFSIGIYDNAALRLGSYVQKQINSNDFTLELTIESSSSLFTKLKLGVLDVAICVESTKLIMPKHISLIKTFSEELLPVSSKKFTEPVDSIPFIFYNKTSYTREQTDKTFADKKMNPTVFAESTSTTFMKELAILGSGVALLPKNFINAELDQKTLVRQHLPLKWERTYGIYINNDSILNESHRFIKDLVKELKQAK